ncbi:DUF4142 domain-containing protein [Mucilaginibacter sp.]|uniref:DUF4142 domain-containing protein n=1 Tax=Mucilaginibacter sp. TaxID=1882438 RepID=UPI000CBA563E|nr:DUF4142 domain-containing protein [Mucilaginibacter sp.]PLW91079.1 MAG: hypothetical protein C0154_03100 [Mucilaginibacter sp.]HEK20930.1 DUF4142 domain-containing protein [Bacteroidota bacterium]
MRRFGAVLLLVMFLEILACNNRKGKNYNKSIDADAVTFVQAANEDALAEIKLSQLALQRTGDTAIISMAKAIVAHHNSAGADIKKLADKYHITLSDQLSTIHQQSLQSLEKMPKGEGFNKTYAQIMVNDHEKAIALFKNATNNTSGDIQDFAEETLPKLEAHFKVANTICTDLK